MANQKVTYICPGCGKTSKRGFGFECKCGYQICEYPNRFPSIEELISGNKNFENNWNDVDLIKFTQSIVNHLINSKQLELTIKLNNESERI